MPAPISDRCRNYWVMPRSGPRRCILIRLLNGLRKFITRPTLGRNGKRETGNVERIHSTTILCVRRDGKVAIGGDGQVTVGETVMKANANKVRTLRGGQIRVGFGGAAAAG